MLNGGVVNCSTNPSRCDSRFRGAGVLQQDGEFVTTTAREYIRCPDATADRSGYRLQQPAYPTLPQRSLIPLRLLMASISTAKGRLPRAAFAIFLVENQVEGTQVQRPVCSSICDSMAMLFLALGMS